jgi:hypothetical protein
MRWTIRFRANKADSTISSIQIEAESLREACVEVLSLYRSATILDYQENSGNVKQLNLSDIKFQMHPVDFNMFSGT